MESQTSPPQEFLDDMEKYGVKNWTNPLAFYDYYKAWSDGVVPEKIDGRWKWPSAYKHPLSHERYIMENNKIIDTITGKEALEEDKIMNDIKREEFLKDFTNF